MSDKLKFNDTAIRILHDRYLWRDDDGNVTETPKAMLERVARVVAKGDTMLEKCFYAMMADLDFLPNSPTLMNAGRKGIHGQLSACFVLDVEDSMEGIFEALKRQALIHKSGGGTGFNFSKIRPRGSKVNSTNGVASGVISFMELFNTATEKVMQGGMRRGANMAILNADHPEIMDFIRAKTSGDYLSNFNLSVGITDEQMENYGKEGWEWFTEVYDAVAAHAWMTGDPGIVFLDRIDENNPTPSYGKITATNPCGESPLLPNEACNLGSINLSNFYNKETKTFDYRRLREVVQYAVIFLDNVIDVNVYPLEDISKAVMRTRKIGLGVMGWADLLYKMDIKYSSKEALELAEKIMSEIHTAAYRKSILLGLSHQPYPAYSGFINKIATRNATVTCIAPTGTISLLAGCSSGIEPVFSLSHTRRITLRDGTEKQVTCLHPEYEEAMNDEYDTRFEEGVFETAHDITPLQHIKMQAAFQKYTDLAVSKTVNMCSEATKDDVRDVHTFAWKFGCKGITIYRDGSKDSQVLLNTTTAKCEECGEEVIPQDGCWVCPTCGWSPCGV